MKLVYKNFESSEFLQRKVEERILTVIKKYRDPKLVEVTVTIEMENSPFKRGPDLYSTSVTLKRAGVLDCHLTKSAINALASISAVSESLQVVLSKKKRLAQRSSPGIL